MSETLTFANYTHYSPYKRQIYEIGLRAGIDDTGVIPEIAEAFNHDLTKTPQVDNLGDLIGAVGPAKELQNNIERVQETLGTDDSAVDIARGWVQRSGLLLPVAQVYMTTQPVEGKIDIAIITPGVRNWMVRRADEFEKVYEKHQIENAYLVGGTRLMKTAEGPDVEEGMTEADFMQQVIAKRVEALGVDVKTVKAESSVGDEVMAAVADEVYKYTYFSAVRIANISNAGAWVQNGGQLLRALRSVNSIFNSNGNNFSVFSDEFELGSGVEPTSTHQNPFTALGAIARNAQELARIH